MSERSIEGYRYFLKDSIRKELDFSTSDQQRGIPPPEVQKPFRPEQTLIDLTRPEEFDTSFTISLTQAIKDRKSVRHFSDDPLTLGELSYLLWSTQGLHRMTGPTVTIRTVPSAGARHAFETYLYIRNVTGNGAKDGVLLQEGIYRYLPLTHQLAFEFEGQNLSNRVSLACFNQRFVSGGAVTFFWAAVPYRMEWRYGLAAHKVIAIDVGHVCQNLYLAVEAIGAGTCGIGAYDQEHLDVLLKLDGEDEFVVYLAPVGKKP
jgi:SagB-type dehydrogenase family enzyme